MVIITISTVGYSEVQPLISAGKIYSAILILINIGIFAAIVSAFSHYIIQGEYFRTIFLKRMKKKVEKLNNHVIICGYGRYGNEIVDTLVKHKIPFVVLEKNKEKVEAELEKSGDLLIVQADATDDDTLVEAGIHRATALIAALSLDMDNLFVSMSARQLNDEIKIISKAIEPNAVPKLRKAGADHVIMPELLGGFYMATLVSKPGATLFFSYIADEVAHDIDFEEVFVSSLPEKYHGGPIGEIQIRKHSGANIIGIKGASGNYLVNPPDDTQMRPDAAIIVLGNSQQLDKMRMYIGSLN